MNDSGQACFGADSLPAAPGFEHLTDVIDVTLLMHKAMKRAVDSVEHCISMVNGVRIPRCLAILGESGVGKTTVVDEVERRYPIEHTAEGTMQRIVRVEIGALPSPKSLPAWTLAAMGYPTPWSGSAEFLTWALYKLAKRIGTKAFVFDEGQHFVEKDTEEMLRLRANWFKKLADETKTVVVLVGLEQLVSIFQQDPQIRGRFKPPVVLPRFNWADAHDRDEFIKILYGFDQAMRAHFDLPSLVTPEMAWHCYGTCGGLMRPLWVTLRAAVHKACARGSKVLRLEDFAEASREEVFDVEDLTGMPRPFTREFNPIPTIEILAEVAKIGVRKEELGTGIGRRALRKRGVRGLYPTSAGGEA